MNITIKKIKREEKNILKNLWQKYVYEYSQYSGNEMNNNGLFSEGIIDLYWIAKDFFPYFIRVNGKLIGFLLIDNDYPGFSDEVDFNLANFFIIYKYRRNGIGKYVINHIFNKYKGKWKLLYHPKNKVAKLFWLKTINEYTKGKYKIIKNSNDFVFKDGSKSHTILFNNKEQD